MNNAGQNMRPPRGLGDMDYAAWSDLFAVNTLAPFKMIEAFQDHLRRSDRKIVVNVSSVMGSIADTSGGHVAYRTTKAALNMVTKVLAGDLAGDGIIVFSIHPGWVRTDMGGPDGDVSADESAVVLRAIFENLSPADTGKYINYTGEDLPW